MSQQGRAAESAASSLSRTESDRRKAILGLLKEALAARRISSVLVGRRTLVLRSAQGQKQSDIWEELKPRLAEPQLYVFAAGCSDVHRVTTDGKVYWFARDRGVPVQDPGYAARAYSRWARSVAER
jgi:hypothetical protein